MDDLIAPIAQELTGALGIEKDILQRELWLLIVKYKVPVEEAKRSVIRKYRRSDPGKEDRRLKMLSEPENSSSLQADAGDYKLLKDIRNGDSGITVIVNVVDPTYKELDMPAGRVLIIEGMLEDPTARVHFTSWVDVPDIFSIRRIVIRNAFVKSYQGVPEININESSVLEEYTEDLPGYKTRQCSILELIEGDGAFDIEAEGDIISLRPGSGLIERCPQCNRVMQKGNCRAHGKLEGKPDLRIKAVLDDGTGSMICVFDRGLTRALLGKDLEEFIKNKDSAEKIEETIKSSIIGMPLIVRGNVTKGDYGVILVTSSISRPAYDIQKLARALMGELQ
jgi:replication factor A1